MYPRPDPPGVRQVGGGPGQLRGGPLLQGRAGGQLLGDHEAAAVELEGQDRRWAKPRDKLVSSLKHINHLIAYLNQNTKKKCLYF